MTKIITRYFDSAEQAQRVRQELIRQRRFAPHIIYLDDAKAGLVDRLTAKGVMKGTAEAYHKKIGKTGAVLLVRAGHKPLSVAQTTRDVTEAYGGLEIEGLVEEVAVPTGPPTRSSVMRDHPRFFTRQVSEADKKYRMADWPIPLISRRKPFRETVFPPHARMANFPIPLISRHKPYSEFAFPKHKRFADFPLPLLSDRKPYTKMAFEPHARMANFPIPLISRRKPYTGSLIPRHGFMATWPFPHLINQRTGGNALMPGALRMANFPIPLLSDRKPFSGSAIPRHGRMANFPLKLISNREPYNEMKIERHGRMADKILPLVVRRAEDGGKGSGFSLSKLFKVPTILR